ncbi:hypothetical protein B0A50_00208 [Salinomyces thailandicus]|uniref:Phosphatidate cytidylyltransferase n=1 Tax=Salinomyces thailandicus TaxID=706561 RepID=A0A4U0UFA4_9PEZI|nr:hypothetical protein B0A50_00208 [Salinomyces thailandica]
MPSRPVPATRVISPSPTPTEQSARDGYFAKPNARLSSVERVEELSAADEDTTIGDLEEETEEDVDLARARPRNRSSQMARKAQTEAGERMMNGRSPKTSAQAQDGVGIGLPTPPVSTSTQPRRRKQPQEATLSESSSTSTSKPPTTDLLTPASAYPRGLGSAYWRNLSRSPSPLGLIPVHRSWRTTIHNHELPRKALHVSIGFLTLYLFHLDFETSQIHPVLLNLLIPIFLVDIIRFRWPAFNRFYIGVMGPFMREAEAHDRYNGVISYLAGLWFTLRFCSKDVGVMSVLLLSWCDTAASTFGRWLGRYTPRIRKGKSLAGSLAAFVVGVATAGVFWGVLAPAGARGDQAAFAFQGSLMLPAPIREAVGLSAAQATVEGGVALAVLSVFSGLAASVGEAIDLGGLDDNLTIPILCGLELEGFLWGLGTVVR